MTHKSEAIITLSFFDMVTARHVIHQMKVELVPSPGEGKGSFKMEVLEDEPRGLDPLGVKIEKATPKYLDLHFNRCRLLPNDEGHLIITEVQNEGSDHAGEH